MKPNHKYEWVIALNDGTNIHTANFTGTVDGALAEADQLEDEVTFDVTQIILTRGNLASALYIHGPAGALKQVHKDRQIQVSRVFPQSRD